MSRDDAGHGAARDATGRSGSSAPVSAGAHPSPLRSWGRYAWPTRPWVRFALLAILAVGVTVRLAYVAEPLRFDEAGNAVYYGYRSILHAMGGSAGNENHALQSTLGWLSLRTLGWGTVQFRVPTFLSGVLAIWVMFGVGRWLLASRGAALLAAAVAAVTPWWTLYSVNGRGYIHQVVLLPLVFALVVRAVRGDLSRSGARALGLWAGVLSALGAFAVRSMLVWVVPLGVLVGLHWLGLLRTGEDARPSHEGGRRTAIGRFAGWWIVTTGVLTGLLYGPATAANGMDGLMGVSSRFEPGSARAGFAYIWGQWDAVIPRLFDSQWGWVAPAAYGVVLLGAVLARRRLKDVWIYGVLAVACSFALFFTVGAGPHHRVLQPVGFVAVLLFAAAVGESCRRIEEWLGLRRPLLRSAALVLVAVAYPLSWLSADLVNLRNETGDVPESRVAATLLFEMEGWRESAIVLPGLWDAPVAFYAIEEGHGLPHLVGFDLAERRHDACEVREVIVLGLDEELPEIRNVDLRTRLTGEVLGRGRFHQVEAGWWRLALGPCP